MRFQKQVLGRVAREGEFREDHEIGALVARLRDALADLGRVALEVAHGRVDLRKRSFQEPVAHGSKYGGARGARRVRLPGRRASSAWCRYRSSRGRTHS